MFEKSLNMYYLHLSFVDLLQYMVWDQLFFMGFVTLEMFENANANMDHWGSLSQILKRSGLLLTDYNAHSLA